MGSSAGVGGGAAEPWYRVIAIPDACYGGTPERDYASMLPAVLKAAQHRRPFVAGWFSRGGGAPLELITNAGPLPPAPALPLTSSSADEPARRTSSQPPGGAGPMPSGAGRRRKDPSGESSDPDRLASEPVEP